MTVVVRRWLSFPVPVGLEVQCILTAVCAVACLAGVIWFNRTLNLVRIHLKDGTHELVTRGPFAYVRHPLYATIMFTVPPLFVIWFSDLLFVAPWVLIIVAAHWVVSFEEQGLAEAFGEAYERYRRDVPALLPIRSAAGRRHRTHRDPPGAA
jgi:protein-S-isoprenylcysteine O-methyltransferase Ste14